MLSSKEEAGVKEILNLMSPKDVASLANTMTNHLIKLETLNDAVNAICLYASNAAEVLSRRKVKKEVLFRYLHIHNAVADPHGEKVDVVNAILKRWQSPVCQTLLELKSYPREVENPTPVDSPASSVACYSPMQQMGETFVSWFYRLLNSVHPKFPNPVVDGAFGAHHFWSDCRLQLELRSPEQQMQHSCDSAEEVATTLRNVVLETGLLFNPNVTSEGVQTVSEPHGLVRISVCGVVHSVETCVGMFKQAFGLVQDVTKPDNWKIKFTDLRAVCNSDKRQPLPITQDGLFGQRTQLTL